MRGLDTAVCLDYTLELPHLTLLRDSTLSFSAPISFGSAVGQPVEAVRLGLNFLLPKIFIRGSRPTGPMAPQGMPSLEPPVEFQPRLSNHQLSPPSDQPASGGQSALTCSEKSTQGCVSSALLISSSYYSSFQSWVRCFLALLPFLFLDYLFALF